MKYFLTILPIRIRMSWRRVLWFFGYNTYAMAMDDICDVWLLQKIKIGFALLPALKYLTKELENDGY